MAIRVREQPNSRRLTGTSTFTWTFFVYGTDSIDDAADAVFLYSQPNYGFWVRNWAAKTITPDPNGGGFWVFEVPYNVGEIPLVTFPSLGGGGSGGGVGGSGGGGYTLPGDEVALGPEWSGDFSATTVQERRSREIVGGLQRDETGDGPLIHEVSPVVGGGPIGFDPSTDTVEGIAVPKGVQTITIELKVPGVTLAWLRRIEARQFHVNNEAIFGRAPGEVRFEGCRVQFRYADGMSVALTFGIAKNQTNLEVGRFIVLPKVEGWDYVDPTYTKIKDPDDDTLITREVTKATIHRVHPRSDLNELFT